MLLGVVTPFPRDPHGVQGVAGSCLAPPLAALTVQDPPGYAFAGEALSLGSLQHDASTGDIKNHAGHPR